MKRGPDYSDLLNMVAAGLKDMRSKHIRSPPGKVAEIESLTMEQDATRKVIDFTSYHLGKRNISQISQDENTLVVNILRKRLGVIEQCLKKYKALNEVMNMFRINSNDVCSEDGVGGSRSSIPCADESERVPVPNSLELKSCPNPQARREHAVTLGEVLHSANAGSQSAEPPANVDSKACGSSSDTPHQGVGYNTTPVDGQEQDESKIEAAYNRYIGNISHRLMTAVVNRNLTDFQKVFREIDAKDKDESEQIFRDVTSRTRQGRTTLMKIVQELQLNEARPYLRLLHEKVGRLYKAVDFKTLFFPQIQRKGCKPYTAISIAIDVRDMDMLQFLVKNFSPWDQTRSNHVPLWYFIGRENDENGHIVSNKLATGYLEDLFRNTETDIQNYVRNVCPEARLYLPPQ